MTNPWIDATPEEITGIPVTTGVYEIRDQSGELLDIGYAGSREPFGLRSLLQRLVGEIDTDGLQFRYEQHVQYHTRYIELVLNHRARHDGVLPQRVAERRPLVHGHLSP
ncbi:hypothetical protein [Mycolicibacterium goodii]|uniref:DUF7508 domain-containing protein n=1 Tax=Mycolicibacterium goodii TaxID=134601 RepID=UPI000AD31AAA